MRKRATWTAGKWVSARKCKGPEAKVWLLREVEDTLWLEDNEQSREEQEMRLARDEAGRLRPWRSSNELPVP